MYQIHSQNECENTLTQKMTLFNINDYWLYIRQVFDMIRIKQPVPDIHLNNILYIMNGLAGQHSIRNMTTELYGDIEVMNVYPYLMLKTNDIQIKYKSDNLMIYLKGPDQDYIQSCRSGVQNYNRYMIANRQGLFIDRDLVYSPGNNLLWSMTNLQKVSDWIEAMFFWDLQSQYDIEQLLNLYDPLVSGMMNHINQSLFGKYITDQFDQIDIEWLIIFCNTVYAENTAVMYKSNKDNNGIKRMTDSSEITIFWDNLNHIIRLDLNNYDVSYSRHVRIDGQQNILYYQFSDHDNIITFRSITPPDSMINIKYDPNTQIYRIRVQSNQGVQEHNMMAVYLNRNNLTSICPNEDCVRMMNKFIEIMEL